MLSGFFALSYVPAGAMFNTYTPGLVEVGKINQIDGKVLNSASGQGILDLIEENNLTDDLILGEINFTKVVADGETYYTTIESLKAQLEQDVEAVGLYEDLPAINAGLRGAIVEVNGVKIKTHDDLALVLEGYSVGDSVEVVTKDYENGDGVLEYELKLGEDPNEEGRAVIGIGFFASDGRILGKITEFFNFFKKPATYYEPRFNADLVIFIYNLIWWLALINLSVALINMWPVAIFDGGRMFMLSVWGLTGSEKLGMFMFKLMTWLILGALALLMIGWYVAVF